MYKLLITTLNSSIPVSTVVVEFETPQAMYAAENALDRANDRYKAANSWATNGIYAYAELQ